MGVSLRKPVYKGVTGTPTMGIFLAGLSTALRFGESIKPHLEQLDPSALAALYHLSVDAFSEYAAQQIPTARQLNPQLSVHSITI